MMMETIKKTTILVVLLISCNLMAQGIYGEDIPYPRYRKVTEDQLIAEARNKVDGQLKAQFNGLIVDKESGCTISTPANGKPYYSLVLSDCTGLNQDQVSKPVSFSVPVSGWSRIEIPTEEQLELVTKKQFSKEVYKQLDQEQCDELNRAQDDNYENCGQRVIYTLLFTDYRVLYGVGGDDEAPYRLDIEIKTINSFWNTITDEPVVGNLPKRQDGPSSVETIKLVLKY